MPADTSFQENIEKKSRGHLWRAAQRTAAKWLLKNRNEQALTNAVTALIEQPTDRQGEAGREKALLTNIMALAERTIADCMCPRADIVGIESGISFSELVRVFSAEGHSRLPVYRKELDEVIGMIHLKDVLSYLAEGRTATVDSLLRPVTFVPPTKPILDLLLEMRETRQHLAVVVDEFGGVDGLVTIEDLVEQIVGEINDEHDETAAPSLMMRPDGSWLVDARMPLSAFSESIPVTLKEEETEEIDTLGGLVLSLANRIPKRGENFIHASGYEFEVIDADRRRIKRIRVRAPKAASAEAVSNPISMNGKSNGHSTALPDRNQAAG